MRRRLFAEVSAVPLLLFFATLPGCVSHDERGAIPDIKHPIVYRTDSPPETLAAMPPDAAKAILIARSYWEVSPYVQRRGTGPFTLSAWHEGGFWAINVERAGTNGSQLCIGSDWKVSLTIGW